MDTPNRQVSWLERFPPDIWAYFSQYLPGEQLERLLMTGATLLRQRLTSHPIVKSVILGEDFMIFKSLSRLFNDFRYVEELCIYSSTAKWSDKLAMTIDSMPLGLRILALSGTWNKPTDLLFDKDGTTLKLNEHLPHLEILDLQDLTCENFAWMTHCPQSLTDLYLDHWDGSVELPTSLIKFGARDVSLSTSSFVSKLPPSLEEFYAGDLKGSALLVPLLPASLRELFIPLCIRGRRFNGNALQRLPKSLTFLKVTDSDAVEFKLNPEFVSHLSPTLKDLHVEYYIPCSDWRLLPPQLTNLSFSANSHYSTVPSKTVDSNGVHHEVVSIPFDYFPRSITIIQLLNANFFCGPPTTSDGSYFPPKLTILDLDVQLSPETVKVLPSSLTFLRIGNLCEKVCEHLHNGIKTLLSNSTLWTPNLVKFLPKSLTSLRLIVSSSTDKWYDHNTGRKFLVEEHPQYSVQQDCLSPSFDWKDHSPLPSTLTELRIRDAVKLGDTFLQHQQLPNLKTLELLHSKHLTDLSIPHLPHRLTVLILLTSAKISGKSFKFLPRGLIHLELGHSESIFDCDIQHLPRALVFADLSNAIHLTELCIPDLPPRLEWLYMNCNSQISPSCLPKLPYTLRSTHKHRTVEFRDWRVASGVLKVTNSTSAK